VIAVLVAEDPVVDCVLVVAPAPVTSANAKPIKYPSNQPSTENIVAFKNILK